MRRKLIDLCNTRSKEMEKAEAAINATTRRPMPRAWSKSKT